MDVVMTGLPVIVIAMIWGVILLSAFISYYFWGRGGYFNKIYEGNQRLGANNRYVIRFKFENSKKGFNIKTTTIRVQIWTSNDKPISLFTISPKLLQLATATQDKTLGISKQIQYEVKFVFVRKTPLSKIVAVTLNHNGTGTIFVSTLEIQRVDWFKANVVFISEFIQSLPDREAYIRQKYPAGTQENREVETEALELHVINFYEYMAFIWMTMNLISLLSLFVSLCQTTLNDETDHMKLHFCTDYHDKLFSSTSTALINGSLSTIVFVVSILIYRFIVKKGIAQGSGLCSFFEIVYIVVVITTGALSGIFAAYDGVKRAQISSSNTESNTFQTYWSLAVLIGIVVYLTVWCPLLSIIGHCIGFFESPKVSVKDLGDTPDDKSNPKGKSAREDKDKAGANIISANTKVKSISHIDVKPAKDKSTKNESKTEGSVKKPKKTSSQESIGEGYYKQLMKGKTKVKSVSQY